MAAYAALVSLMQIIHELENHPFPPISIDKQQLKSLTENVTFLEEFLERYDSPVDGNEADPLERRIAGAAYAAEDVIESHVVDVIDLERSTTSDHDEETDSGEGTTSSSDQETKSSSGEETASSSGEEDDSGEGTTSSSDQETKSISGEEDDSREGTTSSSGEEDDSGEGTTSSSSEEANHIINLNEALQQVIEEMNLIKKEVSEINTQRAVIHAYVASSRSSSTEQKIPMVGAADALSQLLDHLTNPPDFQVIPIVGMGGIGKTTLAEKAYSEKIIKEHFYVCAWATISQQYDTREILCDLVSQVTGINKEQLSQSNEGQLGLQLWKCLFGQKFLIVMDDMWSIEAWNKIQNLFPKMENGSRILVTTRLSDLSSQLTNNYTLQMKFLDEGSSWELFCITLFGEKSCPPSLERIGKKIIENCRGLPLSIIVVGGILRNIKPTQACWESIWKNSTSMVNMNDDEHCFKLLKMSYNHLPVYLKPCFLYLGAFDEDDKIVVSTLIKLWVSEGILRPKNGESLETIAQEFLKDLADRNLIIIDKSWMGRTRNIKYCKIHDLLRDLCMREGRKDGFYHIIGQDSPPGINGHRRIVIPYTASKKEIFDALRSTSHVRSIICDDDDDDKVQACRKSRLLRIISARNQVDGSDGNPLVFQFVNLRHATVEAHGELSINHLWNLQTLIVYSYEKLDAPVGIWKMPQLRHIEFLDTKLHLPDPPSDVVIMENLQTLKGVQNFKCSEEVVKRIPNIKRLLIEYDRADGSSGSNDDYYCLRNIGSLSKLESLTCGELLRDGGRIHHLQKLTLPHSIKKLTLTTSYDDDMLEKIGLLPLLQKLKMVSGSFKTGKWEVVEGQFPCLTSLTLLWCRGLKCWMAKEGSVFPCLEQLRLSRLSELKEIPSEIGYIPTLQTIELNHCSKSAVKCAKNIVDEQEEWQGEITFHVSVVVSKKFEELNSLASPNFEVEVIEYA